MEFNSVSDYYNYIVLSVENGQIKQARELFDSLSANQKLDFYSWILEFSECNSIQDTSIINYFFKLYSYESN